MKDIIIDHIYIKNGNYGHKNRHMTTYGCQKYTVGMGESLQQMMLGKILYSYVKE